MANQLPNEEKKAPQPYLDADFSKELNYQLWVTKGSRFHASRRLRLKQKWSTYTITALSLYAITANLAIVYDIAGAKNATSTIAFVSSVMSILILIVSLLEGSRNYDLQANRFHECALKLGKLYRQLRQIRTDTTQPPKLEEVRKISDAYQEVLDSYENHEDIDYYLMQAKKSEWFQHGLPMRLWFRLRWYLQTMLVYHFAIVVPPVAYSWWQVSQ